MSQNVVFNGVTYTIPNTGDENWGSYTTTYLVAIPSGCLQKTGGGFTLLADVNFGASFGLISTYFKSRSANIAAAGAFRLANTDLINWRNSGNSGDNSLGVDVNTLVWNGDAILTTASGGAPVVGKDLQGCTVDDYLQWTNASTPSTPTVGFISTFLNSGVLSYVGSDAVVRAFIDNSSTQTLTNKTLTSPVISSPTLSSYAVFNEISAPSSPGAGTLSLYAKNDDKLYIKNSAGTESEIATANASVPTGVIMMWSQPSPPTGFLICDGSLVSRSTYAALFSALSNGVIWGTGNGSTTFALPDMRGLFVRGVDQGAGRDPNAAGRTAIATGGATGNNAGSYEADAFTQHTHAVSDAGHNHTQNSHNHTQDAHNHTQNAHSHGITDGGHRHNWSVANNVTGGNIISGGSVAAGTSTGSAINSATTGVTVNNATAVNQSTTATNQATTASNNPANSNITVGNSASASAGSETRPKNVYVYYIIKT
jgi:microcystin-dependent protein